jgi:hypothetical protein
VEEFFSIYSSSELVAFECKCNEHYEEYKKIGAWPAETETKCKQFVACLNNQRTASVKVITAIAKALKSVQQVDSFAEDKAIAHAQPQSADCFEPTAEKYQELTECNCLKGLTRNCGEDAGMEPTVVCLKMHACRHDNVCESWKDANDCSDLLLQLQLLEAGQLANSSLTPAATSDHWATKAEAPVSTYTELQERRDADSVAQISSTEARLEGTLQSKCA